MAETFFSLASYLALAGWGVLIAGVVLKRTAWRDMIAGRLVPVMLALGYTFIIAVHWWSADGGFGSLAQVQSLFTSPWVALGGRVHYLAYDLFIGALMARRVMEQGLSRLLLIPILPLCFLFGPIGFLAAQVLLFATEKKV